MDLSMRDAPAMERFCSRVDPIPCGGCWMWTGWMQSSGYGCISVEGKTWLAHRWSYTQFVGPIPDGLQIDHLCRNRLCVNPMHLEAVTPAENTRRGVGPALAAVRLAAFNKANPRPKTHCPQGHPYAGANLRRGSKGEKCCRICTNERARRYRERKAAS